MREASASFPATKAAMSEEGKVEAAKLYETVDPAVHRGIMPSIPTRNWLPLLLVNDSDCGCEEQRSHQLVWVLVPVSTVLGR